MSSPLKSMLVGYLSAWRIRIVEELAVGVFAVEEYAGWLFVAILEDCTLTYSVDA